MITIPYGTDTAIYYWPYATIALIVINVIAFPVQFAIPSAPVEIEAENELDEVNQFDLESLIKEASMAEEPGWMRFALSHGDGLHPIQWVTSNFIHGGLFHLIGNMIFLWAFGLVVEGKIGPVLFPMMYLAIGVAQCAAEQVLFLDSAYGHSFGASAAIYGVLAASMLFAPKDNLMCLFWIFRFVFFFMVPILIFGLFYVLWDFGISLFSGFGISSALLHVMGAGVGFAFAVILLNTGVVKTDNEDLFALLYELFTGKKKKKKLTRREKAQREEQREQKKIDHEESVRVAWRSFDTHFAAGNVEAAVNVVMHMKRKDPSQKWNESRLLKIIRHYAGQKDWDKVNYFSQEYLTNFTSQANTIRLNLAKICLLHLEQPRQAIKFLQDVDPQTLDAESNNVAKKLVAKAKKMIAEGTIEFRDD